MDPVDRVAEILGEWQERREEGREPSPEELIAAHPELAAELRSHFAFLGLLDHGASATEELPDGVPDAIGDFRIVREIGRGGMGVVYEAEQMSMHRRVALKVLSLAVGAAPHAVKRFEREARAAGTLHHTNIVPIYAMGQHAGHWYYAMELVEGRALSQVLAGLRSTGRTPTEESLARLTAAAKSASAPGTGVRSYFVRVADMFAGVAEALDLAHHEGIIHRDVKPSNLLLDANGVLKIVDFGLAHRAGAEGPSITMTGDLLGTPVYMSPEQALAKRVKVDHRTDVYSLGATLYEVLTLRPPFDGTTLAELCSQITTKDPRSPRQVNERVPRDFATIVMKAMEKDRDRRYQSAQALADDLRRFANGEAIRARPIGVAVRAWRRVGRHKVRSALVAAAVVLACAGAWFARQAANRAAALRDAGYEQLLLAGEAALGEALASRRVSGEFEAAEAGAGEEPLAKAVALRPQRWEAYWLRSFVPGRTLAQRLADVDAAWERGGLTRRARHLQRATFALGAGGEDASADREQAAALPATSALEHYCEGRLAAIDGDLVAALEHLDRALEGPAAPSVPRLLACRFRAMTREETGNLDGALEDYSQLRAMSGQSLWLEAKITSLWCRLGREAAAERGFERLMELAKDEKDPGRWAQICEVFSQAGQVVWLEACVAKGLRNCPGAPDLLVCEGVAAARRGDLAAALASTRRALEADDRHGPAWVNLAAYLNDAGDPGKALEAVERASALGFGRHATRARLGALLKLARFADVLVICRGERPGAAAGESRGEYWWGEARALHQSGRVEESLQAYEAAERLRPRDTAVLSDHAKALIDLGRFREAAELCTRRIELEPDEAAGWNDRSLALGEIGEFDRALADSTRAVELADDEGAVWLNHGNNLLAHKRADEALAAYDRALACGYDHPRVHLNRGTTLANLKQDYEAALAAFDRGIEMATDSEVTEAQFLWTNRGNVLFNLDRREEAIASYRRAIDMGVKAAQPFLNAGMLLANQERWAEAAPLYEKGLELGAPAYPGHWYNFGQCCRHLGRMDDARGAFTEFIARAPENPDGYHARADVARQSGDAAAFLADGARAVELGWGDAEWANTIAWISATAADESLRSPARAVRCASRAVELSPGTPTWTTLGVALYRAGDAEEALEALAKAIELNGGATGVQGLFVAMARHRLGRDDARAAYDGAVAWMEKHAPDHAELKRLRAEAQQTLGIDR